MRRMSTPKSTQDKSGKPAGVEDKSLQPGTTEDKGLDKVERPEPETDKKDGVAFKLAAHYGDALPGETIHVDERTAASLAREGYGARA